MFVKIRPHRRLGMLKSDARTLVVARATWIVAWTVQLVVGPLLRIGRLGKTIISSFFLVKM
jgi:hypothetical protein